MILDDTDNRQNRPVDTPNTAYYHPAPGLSTTNVVRGGDTIANLTGVLHWSFAGLTGTDAWRIRPVAEAFPYAFTPANPRPAPPAVGGRLKVASFNVLNYFPTIDTTSSDSNGACGASATLDCRGADSVAEFTRQRAKLTQALLGLDADIVGLIEMENTPGRLAGAADRRRPERGARRRHVRGDRHRRHRHRRHPGRAHLQAGHGHAGRRLTPC